MRFRNFFVYNYSSKLIVYLKINTDRASALYYNYYISINSMNGF
ncbi:hypothetical protein HMPREF0496_1129 [Lentilactobacillus hilgardii ATCC 27305]|nr:hypothetical protein HMPREF0496_1129 [Lentilactobacillus hilgardii ATCC 27305]